MCDQTRVARSSVEDPERSHEGGEDAGEGGGALHEHAHGGVVHLKQGTPVTVRVVNCYSSKPDLLVKTFLLLLPVNRYFTSKNF